MSTTTQGKPSMASVAGNLKMIDDATLQRMLDQADKEAIAKLKASLLLKLEEAENDAVAKMTKFQAGGRPHNADVEAGKRKGIRVAKTIVRDS